MLIATRGVIAVLALLAASSAAPQGVVTQRILSLAAARTIAEAALAACTSQGFRTSVAVVDRSGNLLVVLRHELAHPATLEMARSKAYTAVVFRGSTAEFQAATANDPARLPQRDVPGILALGRHGRIELEGLEVQVDRDRVADAAERRFERVQADRAPGAGDVRDEIDAHRWMVGAQAPKSTPDSRPGAIAKAIRRRPARPPCGP